jgi:hypothetical protein
VKRTLAILMIAAAGCRTVPMGTSTTTGGGGGGGAGAATPQDAVAGMLAGAKAGDLQAMTAYWGDEQGLNRNKWSRDEVESRAFILQCVLKSDTNKISTPLLGPNGHMYLSVDLTQGKSTATTRFETARTRDGRWLVANMDVVTLQNKGFCSRASG